MESKILISVEILERNEHVFREIFGSEKKNEDPQNGEKENWIKRKFKKITKIVKNKGIGAAEKHPKATTKLANFVINISWVKNKLLNNIKNPNIRGIVEPCSFTVKCKEMENNGMRIELEIEELDVDAMIEELLIQDEKMFKSHQWIQKMLFSMNGSVSQEEKIRLISLLVNWASENNVFQEALDSYVTSGEKGADKLASANLKLGRIAIEEK